MKRNAIEHLITWKEAGGQLPALLYGCKGCGKTWLALDFAKAFFEGYFYINLENDAAKKKQLEEGSKRVTSRSEMLLLLSECFELPIELFSVFLIIFDETSCSKSVQEMLLNYAPLPENTNPLAEESSLERITCYLLLISSCNDEALTRAIAEPDHLQAIFVAPLQFDEFLMAIGSEWYAEVIQGHYQTSHRIPMIVHKELLDLFEDYLSIGGIPAAINEYLQTESIDNVAEVHRTIFNNLCSHIRKHYDEGIALKMQQVMEVLPAQLVKENQKFQYKLLRKGATYQLYAEAIEALKNNFIVYQCSKLSEENNFKLFPMDVGVYHSIVQYPEMQERIRSLVTPGKFYMPELTFRKDMLDCYFMQTITAKKQAVSFWESASQAKIDFLLDLGETYRIPFEIKTTEASRSRSIQVYRNEFPAPYSIRLSQNNYEISEQQKNIPYYALFCL